MYSIKLALEEFSLNFLKAFVRDLIKFSQSCDHHVTAFEYLVYLELSFDELLSNIDKLLPGVSSLTLLIIEEIKVVYCV